MDEQLELTIGALLHDVGKVAQRASPDVDHAKAGSKVVNSLPLPLDGVAPIVLHHHDPDDILTAIVHEADLLASGGVSHKEDGLQPDELLKPLFSVFNSIKLNRHTDREASEPLAYPPVPIGDTIIFPEKSPEVSAENYKRLLDGFLQFVGSGDRSDPLRLLLNGAEKFFSMIPAEVDEPQPDVSLFDHLKLTAAIAVSIYEYLKGNGKLSVEMVKDKGTPMFLLVGGDLSGIQDFIYSVSYQAALKGLRARSFYIWILLEHFIRTLFDKLSIPPTNVIYIGGGSFYLLLPNTERVKTVIEERQKEFNRWLLREHEGRIFLAVDSIALNGNALTDGKIISSAWRKLTIRLADQKDRKFHQMMDESMFQPEEMENRAVCPVCGKVFMAQEAMKVEGESERGLCPVCYSFEKVSSKLIQSDYIISSTTLPRDVREFIYIEQQFYWPSDNIDIDIEDAVVYRVNALERDHIPLSLGRYPGKPMEFSTVVENSYGAPYLGTLRADVDNLGLIFSHGIPEEVRTIATTATLSRLLSLFFKNYINLIAAGDIPDDLKLNVTPEHERNIVIVYSGGDDLFVTGAWSDVIEFAFELQAAFEKFTCYNPSITISGGIVMTEPKFPIFRIAQVAGEAEDKAKNVDGKNALTAFDTTMKWAEWRKSVRETLFPLLEIGKFDERSKKFVPNFSTGMIYKLLALHDAAFGEIETGMKQSPYLVLPIVAYLLGRSAPHDKKYLEAWLSFSSHAVSKDFQSTLSWFRGLGAPLKWLALLTRGGFGDEH